ncbi:hypothetical protein PG997_001628 [Apiospora hydei]|uniref:Heterokaryon incompatibility protein n=1 Tax=Apiospora hydei TaxID=1337664 RepID=A0ABR1XE32_9PEZI
MMAVYANGYINISADSAGDGNGGLFRQRDPAMFQSFLVPSDRTGSNGSYNCHLSNWDKYVESAPLKARSWVTQERFMSPRVVHFSNDQVHWECVELMTSESVNSSFHIGPEFIWTPEKSFHAFIQEPNSDTKIESLYTIWYRLVESYTTGQLTFISDRPVAIAGLARTFAHLLQLEQKDYICGLWRPYLVLEMMWYTFTSTDRPNPDIPSWSWLSVNGDVWFKTPQVATKYQPVAEVMDVRITASLGDPYGSIVSGPLKIRAPICRAKIRRVPDPHARLDDGPKWEYTFVLGQEEIGEGHSFMLNLDECSSEFMEKVLSQDVYLLLGQGSILPYPETPDLPGSKQS